MSNLAEEIEDLRALIAGLPVEVRTGPFGQVYQKRLSGLIEELRSPKTESDVD